MITSELLPSGFDEMLSRHSQWVSFGALLLSLCQNIETLEINLYRKNYRSTLWPLRDAFGSTNWFTHQSEFLTNLRSLTISFDKCVPQTGLMCLLLFIVHPSLEEFTGINLMSHDLSCALISYQYTIPLKRICLESSNISMLSLGRLLEICPNLESFSTYPPPPISQFSNCYRTSFLAL